ncbi:MAG: energy transducer TonB [Bacteroidia bacterium]|nr:energy transducer TonB [Bacteroidia bacterium]
MIQSNRTGRGLNEVVFENRNKMYGAYALRKEEDKRTLLGLLFTCLIFAAAAIGTHFGGGEPVKALVNILDNAKEPDSVKVYVFENPWEDKEIEKTKETVSKPKTADANYTPSNTEDDSIKTVVDLNTSLIGPSNGDTGTTGTGDHNGLISVVKPEPVDTSVQVLTHTMPAFSGDFLRWLKKSTVYPQLAKDNGIDGKVYVNFVINEQGEVTRLKIVNPKANSLLKNEALRVMSSCPKWTPGNNGKHNVKVSMTVPFNFELK